MELHSLLQILLKMKAGVLCGKCCVFWRNLISVGCHGELSSSDLPKCLKISQRSTLISLN